nr:polyprotein [Rhizoctonia zeae gammaflexivirus 1]
MQRIEQIDAMLDTNPPRRSVICTGTLGVPGSGKSTDVKRSLREISRDPAFGPDSFRVICASLNNREEWRRDLALPAGHGFMLKTWEVAIVSPVSGFVLLDDAGEFPPGYVDLLLFLHPGITAVAFTGDPAQRTFVAPRFDCGVRQLPATLDTLAAFADRYRLTTHRLGHGYAGGLGLATTSTRPASFRSARAPTARLPMLAASVDTVRAFQDCANVPVATVASVQGLTFASDYQLFIDDRALNLDDSTVFVALTRGKRNLLVINRLREGHRRPDSNILHALLTSDAPGLQRSVLAHISACTPTHLRTPRPVIPLEPAPTQRPTHSLLFRHAQDRAAPPTGLNTGGAKPNLRERYLAADEQARPPLDPQAPTGLPILSELPHLDGLFCPAPLPRFQRVEVDDAPVPVLASQVTVLPPADTASFLPEEVVGDPFERELRSERLKAQSDVIHKEDLTRAIFPEQRRDDEVLRDATFAKRIKRRDRATNERLWATQFFGGELLFDAFLTAVPLPPSPLDENLLEACRRENELTQLAHPLGTLLSRTERADPDWAPDVVDIFMKAQTVKKAGKMASPENPAAPVKPGQTIVNFHTSVIAKWGPWARYIAHKVDESMPGHMYVHYRRNVRDLQRFLAAHWRDELSVSSDYEAYDSTQDGVSGNFEALLMAHLGFPTELIDEYRVMKCSLRDKDGPLAVLRHTGEVFTYLFNTLTNIAYTHLKFVIPTGCAQVYGGDDRTLNCVPTIRPAWSRLSRYMSIVETAEVTNAPEFCSWRLRPEGVYKDPRLLYWRCRYMLTRYQANEWAAAYYEELLPLFDGGAELVDRLTDDEASHVRLLVDLFTDLRAFSVNLARVMALRPLPLSVVEPLRGHRRLRNARLAERDAVVRRFLPYADRVGGVNADTARVMEEFLATASY